jgi:hypothetical protein
LRLGSHQLGGALAAREGVITIPQTAFVDTICKLFPVQHYFSDLLLAGIMSKRPDNTVIYILLPETTVNKHDHPLYRLLREDLLAPGGTTLVHLVTSTSLQPRNLPSLAFEIYDKLSRPVHPVQHSSKSNTTYLSYPHFTLAPDDPPKVQLTLQWPIRNYELLNKWRWVHAGYSIDWALGLGVGFVVDGQGEAWVEGFWTWFEGIAQGLAAEWRGAICRTGLMRADEAEG